eukprot:scaffold192239_cov29-Tisochrysis_lutea.AAC.2
MEHLSANSVYGVAYETNRQEHPIRHVALDQHGDVEEWVGLKQRCDVPRTGVVSIWPDIVNMATHSHKITAVLLEAKPVRERVLGLLHEGLRVDKRFVSRRLVLEEIDAILGLPIDLPIGAKLHRQRLYVHGKLAQLEDFLELTGEVPSEANNRMFLAFNRVQRVPLSGVGHLDAVAECESRRKEVAILKTARLLEAFEGLES